MYLIFQSATGYFEKKNGEKYLILHSTDKYKDAFSAIKSQIETINGEKMYYEKNYARIRVNTNDNIPLNKQIYFPSLITIIRCVFEKGKELYPQIYLDECLYQL